VLARAPRRRANGATLENADRCSSGTAQLPTQEGIDSRNNLVSQCFSLGVVALLRLGEKGSGTVWEANRARRMAVHVPMVTWANGNVYIFPYLKNEVQCTTVYANMQSHTSPHIPRSQATPTAMEINS
jgi:hypothetical protein